MNILGEETIMIVLPADHHIEPPEALWSCLDKASKLAKDGWLVTLGIPPTRPETGYGYMETGEMLIPSALRVRRFTEKPSLEKAQKFLEEGNYYWNSGIFIWKAQTLWEELVRHLPEVALPLDKFRNTAWKVTIANLEALYSGFPNISIDHAVMEKSQRVAMVAANFQWCGLLGLPVGNPGERPPGQRLTGPCPDPGDSRLPHMEPRHPRESPRVEQPGGGGHPSGSSGLPHGKEPGDQEAL